MATLPFRGKGSRAGLTKFCQYLNYCSFQFHISSSQHSNRVLTMESLETQFTEDSRATHAAPCERSSCQTVIQPGELRLYVTSQSNASRGKFVCFKCYENYKRSPSTTIRKYLECLSHAWFIEIQDLTHKAQAALVVKIRAMLDSLPPMAES